MNRTQRRPIARFVALISDNSADAIQPGIVTPVFKLFTC